MCKQTTSLSAFKSFFKKLKVTLVEEDEPPFFSCSVRACTWALIPSKQLWGSLQVNVICVVCSQSHSPQVLKSLSLPLTGFYCSGMLNVLYEILRFGPVCKWEKACPVIYKILCHCLHCLVISPLPRSCLTAADTQLSCTSPSPHFIDLQGPTDRWEGWFTPRNPGFLCSIFCCSS